MARGGLRASGVGVCFPVWAGLDVAGVGVKDATRSVAPAKRPWGLDAGSGHVRIVEVGKTLVCAGAQLSRLARMGLTVRCRGDGPSAEVVAQASETLALLASPARLQIVWFIGDEEADVTSLTQALGLAGPAVSQPFDEAAAGRGGRVPT